MARVEAPPIESVDRALRLLQELGRHGSGVMLEELADATSLPKSSVHRTLAALRSRGFAFQQEDGRYLAGSELLRVAFDFYDRVDVRVMLQPLLLRLRDELNETVHLGVLEGADVVYLDKLESRHPLRLTSTIGGRNPAHCTAVGKALLAWTYPSEAELRAWIAACRPLGRRTPSSITDPVALAREMARIRADGFARDMEESEVGVRCIAAPVFVGTSRPRAAVSISAPRNRMSSSRIRAIVPLLVEGASGSAGVEELRQ
ncbi:MAG TPA: IclR family transcriptional regulator [Actinomycetota bacterium]